VIHERPGSGPDGAATEVPELAPDQLSGVFAAPAWLRDLGAMSWLLVGVFVLAVGVIWLLSLTDTIVTPVITAAIVAAVLSPLVALLQRRGLPRAAGAALTLLGLVALGVGLTVLVIGGITSQAPEIERALRNGAQKLQSALQDAGVSAEAAQRAHDDASSGVSNAFHRLLQGVGGGIRALGSLAVFLSFTALSLFFLLKDGPLIRNWCERHLGVPHAVGHTITERTLGALRGYFVGVTAVAAFNAIVIGLGAVVLDVPLAGSIAAVNFVAAYIPYLGAWSAGAFTVLIAYGAQGPGTALIMIVIVLLANGALQQLIQPVAFGAALGIHPLAVLIVTVAAGAVFGTIGLVLAAPLTSAATHISADLARARAVEAQASTSVPPG
jgi:predicted PurR-regulated permease PerM